MVNEQSLLGACAQDRAEDVDIDRLLTLVESFAEDLDRAALAQRVADGIRELLGCADAALIDRADGEGALPDLRAALLEQARAAGRPAFISTRELASAGDDGSTATVWAVAPLSSGSTSQAIVAGWRSPRHGLGPRELRALGVIARWAGAAVDLRDRRAAIQASVQAGEEFVSAAAHELRTPLTPLRLTVDRAARALDAHDDPERAREALAGIDEHLRRMTHVVDTLLEASRVARGDLILVRRDTDLPALVHEVVERFAEQARLSRCAVSVHARGRIVGRWDAQRLREAIAQLLGNAIKFGSGNPVRVELSADEQAANVVVRDEGHGIAAVDHDRIFERFERAVSVRNFGGLGVGLWLAREIVRAHGGDIAVESAVGEGAVFRLGLPLSPRAPPVTSRTAR